MMTQIMNCVDGIVDLFCFLSLNKSKFEIRENIPYFTTKALVFEIFKF